MAEQTLNPATTIAEVLTVSDFPVADKPTVTEPLEELEPEPEATEEAPRTVTFKEKNVMESVSFKEETNVVSELPDLQKKALDELKKLVQEALDKHELTAPPLLSPKEKVKSAASVEEKPAAKETAVGATNLEEGKVAAEEAAPVTVVSEVAVASSSDDDGAKTVEAIEETVVSVAAPTETPLPAEKVTVLEPENVSIWGVPLLADEKSDVVLLKFLRARDFKVKEAFAMLRNTIQWRNNFNIEALLEEDLGNDLEKVVYNSGVDKEGHPVCYNVYGEFQNKGLYEKTFGEKPEKFLRWRVQFLERTIRKDLDFKPDGVCLFVQVIDLKGSPGPFKRELKVATNQAFQILQDNYPEFVAKQIFINVPWWYLAFYKMISPFFTQRTKSKFVLSGPLKSAETLFKYIAPEQIPVQYGGLSKDNEQEFTTADTATEEIIKPSSKSIVEIPVFKSCTLGWEARVIGWDISYEAEFVPNAEGGYTKIIQKPRKIAMADETVLSGSFKAVEDGKVVLTFDNSASFKKKKPPLQVQDQAF